jgi:hypothetical protein
VNTEITAPCLCPIAAKHARPPSSRKIGNRFKADDISPEVPTTKNGCIGIGCANGSIIVFGRRYDKIDPRRKLDFMLATGITGNRAMSKADALLVKKMPPNTKPSDNARAESGPLNAKSSKAALLGGNDLSGVMHPKNGKEAICSEGMGTGGPIFIFLLLATK